MWNLALSIRIDATRYWNESLFHYTRIPPIFIDWYIHFDYAFLSIRPLYLTLNAFDGGFVSQFGLAKQPKRIFFVVVVDSLYSFLWPFVVAKHIFQ